MIKGFDYSPNSFRKLLLRAYRFFGGAIQKYMLFTRVKRLDAFYLSLVSKDCLTKEQHKEIDNLFTKYIKVRHSAHKFYTEKTGQFDKYYIPDSIFQYIIDPFYNSWKKANVIDNKCYYHRMFTDFKLPQLIVYRLAGLWYNDLDEIITEKTAEELIFRHKECFIKKAVNSWGGTGVAFFDTTSQTKEDLKHVLLKDQTDLVIQAAVVQHPDIAILNPDSLNTIRIISMLRQDGSVKIYSSLLRMGLKGFKVDNASSGGISAGIRTDGRLKNVAYTNTGVRFTEHPTSHVHFENVVIPAFAKMQKAVATAHPKFPHFRLISWDIAVDKDSEPVLIEANLCDGELDFHQLNNGPIFKDDTEAILSEVFNTSK